MKEIKVVNVLDIDGKEAPFSKLTREAQKQISVKLHDNVMKTMGYKKKTV